MSTLKKRITRRSLNSTHQKPVEKNRFLDLPFDVIIEVFEYLEPIDLLHSARTTKGLRTFLLDRHRSRHVWKTAVSNVGLPPCPDHLSQPAYAHLAFVPVCHGCFESCDTIEWEVRMRCCSECRSKLTTLPPNLSRPRDKMIQVYLVCLPDPPTHFELHDYGTNVVSVPSNLGYRRSDWEGFSKRAHRATSRRITREEFGSQEEKFWEPIIEHACLCREWEFERLKEQATRTTKLLREQRVKDIKRRLKARGWTDDNYYLTPFLEHPTVSKAVPLTSVEWRKILPELVAFLPVARSVEAYRFRLRHFHHTIPLIRGLRVCPRDVDLYLHSDVRNILQNNTDHQSYSSQKLGPVLPGVMRQWSDNAVNELARLAQEQLGPELANVDLSNVTFRCTRCQGRMGFDAALSHEHLYQRRAVMKRKLSWEYAHMQEPEIYEDVGKRVYRMGSWNPYYVLQVDKDALRKSTSTRTQLDIQLDVPYNGEGQTDSRIVVLNRGVQVVYNGHKQGHKECIVC